MKNIFFLVVLIITVAIISCGITIGSVAFKNQTNYMVDIYIDTIRITTLEPDCFEYWIIEIHHPNVLVVESRNAGFKTISCIIDSSREGIFFFHSYTIEGKVNDSIILQHAFQYPEKGLPLDTCFVMEE